MGKLDDKTQDALNSKLAKDRAKRIRLYAADERIALLTTMIISVGLSDDFVELAQLKYRKNKTYHDVIKIMESLPTDTTGKAIFLMEKLPEIFEKA